jgi:hypothetical protein
VGPEYRELTSDDQVHRHTCPIAYLGGWEQPDLHMASAGTQGLDRGSAGVDTPEGIEGDFSEVRSIIDQLVKIRWQQEMQDLAGRAATDPLAMQRYKELANSLQK